MLAKSFQRASFLVNSMPIAHFSQASKYVGVNDNIRQEKRQMRKFGMKRHFYDHLKLDASAMPTEQ